LYIAIEYIIFSLISTFVETENVENKNEGEGETERVWGGGETERVWGGGEGDFYFQKRSFSTFLPFNSCIIFVFDIFTSGILLSTFLLAVFSLSTF
jgi:hypothetical protein